MNDIPSELYGVPAGALIIGAVAGLEQAGLPGRFAGLTAIVIATVVGTIFLMLAVPHQEALIALGKGFVWGLGIVAVHASVIKPIKAQAPKPVLPSPAVPHG